MGLDNTAKFLELQFKMGSGVRKVKLQFEVNIEMAGNFSLREPPVQGEPCALRSDFSEPLIVMTHRSQWEEAEGILLKYDAFKGPGNQMQIQIPWSQFANALQRHYFRVVSTPRPLASKDLDYLHGKFGDTDVISLNDFDTFWKWFGKVSKQIHLQKNQPLWTKGVIYGFLTKREAAELLKMQGEGTFVIRFSEKNAGQMSVVYVRENVIHHYLMSEEDQKKTIIEFLEERTNLKTVLRIIYDNNGVSSTQPYSKRALIDEFQNPKSKRKKENTIVIHDGYELEMI